MIHHQLQSVPVADGVTDGDESREVQKGPKTAQQSSNAEPENNKAQPDCCTVYRQMLGQDATTTSTG